VCVILELADAILADYSQAVYGLAQANKAILPRDAGGPWGQRIGVSVGGSDSGSLVVSAYRTQRNNPTDWERYSLVSASAFRLRGFTPSNTFMQQVVMNQANSNNPLEATIEFRGKQAKFSYPVGITT